MTEYQEILRGLTTEQESVCTTENDTYLTACPGSGKTLVLTRRLAYFVASNPQSRKWNIAITYTNRAADEITNRLDYLGIDQNNIWTGTIHQFCMQFIIRPYAMYSARLSRGYTIIDKYVQSEYGKEIAKELGISIGLYDDPFGYPKIEAEYLARLEANKEIDFDQILQFSDELVRENDFICSNTASIINSVLVDEFQDTRALQYKILAQICKQNKALSLLFVGDVNQAIYGGLGGVAKDKGDMDALFDTAFEDKSLTGCFRSTQKVVDFYTEFEIYATGVTSVADIKDRKGKLSFNASVSKDKLAECIADILMAELAAGIPDTEICVVAPQWWQLFHLSTDLKKRLPDVSFDAPDISPFKYDPMNPFYLLARLVFTKSGQNVSLRKKTATELLAILRDDYKTAFPENIDNYDVLRTINLAVRENENGMEVLKKAIQAVFLLLRIQLDNEIRLLGIHKCFFEKANDRISKYSIATDYQSISNFFKERQGIVLSTIHGIKGEEYSTVIAFSLLNGHLPHWNYIMRDDLKSKRFSETQKLLYVLCSRAKQNIYLFSEKGHKTKSGNEYTPTDELIAGIQRFKTKRQAVQWE
jgi:superfamily I DNA/RNA helicase